MDRRAPENARPADLGPLGIIVDGAVACAGDRIIAVDSTANVERDVKLAPRATVFDATDCIVSPGLIDAHTHALFTGERGAEFAARLEGATYAQIAERGGGIASSVRALRNASDSELVEALAARLGRMRRHGVTSVEVKTG